MRSLKVDKYLALQERAREDEEYLTVVEEYRAVQERMLEALEEMASEHRDTVVDYLGVVFAANARLLELSLLNAEKS